VPHPFFAPGALHVFAHRGGAGLAPENTLAAFDAGLAAGADGLELDVRLAADGVAVVHHDSRLERTTNLRGPVSVWTSAELARADAGFQFRRDGATPFRGQSIGVPTLRDVLARYRDVAIIIELKEASRQLVQIVLDDVQRADAYDRVCVGSFSWRALRQVRALAPQIATSASKTEVRWALFRSRWRWPLRRAAYTAYQVPEVSRGTRVVTPRFVGEAHDAGLHVQVWTVDRPDAARRLVDWGVDALITDRPDVIVPLARALRASRSRQKPP
jgi:glycerophosphoryl diester phosphodiesterase